MRYVVSLLALAIAPPPIAATQSYQHGLDAKIDSVFAEWNHPDSPGASVAVIENGEVIVSKGYGSAQLEYEIPITPTTVFHVASVSKQFTAMAVALLAAEGKLSLDDDVQEYVPEVPRFEKRTTVRQLMHHTSGIRDQWELLAMAGWRLDDVITVEHILNMMKHQKDLNFEPNSEYLYSNMGYTLLAEIAARVSGMTFPEFTRQRIFEPLGMTQTHFHDDHEHIVKNRAYSYNRNDDSTFNKSVLSYANAGATSLFTTAEDLVKWLENLDHGRVGGPAVLEEMQTSAVLNNGDSTNYGFGVALGEYRGQKTVSHGGGDAGFRTYVMWFPEHKVGIAVLGNLGSFNSGAVTQRVADVVLADVLPAPAVADAEAAAGSDPAPRGPVTIDPEVYDRYLGRFLLSAGYVIELTRDGDRLMAEVAGQPAVQLFPLSEIQFTLEAVPGTVTFHPTSSARTDSMTVALEGAPPWSGTRIDLTELSPEHQAAYGGEYYSDELGTSYTFGVRDGGLFAEHRRHGTIAFNPIDEDVFVGNRWFFQRVVFQRDEQGHVTGFLLEGSRVRHLRFMKMESR